MPDIAFLGPQYRDPNLRAALRLLEIDGPLAAITAGWQEREGELDELRQHIRLPVTELGLYRRAEQVWAEDAQLRSAARRRQERLRELQDLYRLRLGHAKQALRELLARDGDPALLRQARRAALAALRRLDREHLRRLEREHSEFERALRPLERASLLPHLAELRRQIEPAAAVLIAGGHVAVLANRLRLFGLRPWLEGKPLIAWSAGAMVLSERIVLFHDHPPQGAGNAEVFDSGLGLLRDVVPLPAAQTRLALHDSSRILLLARRFAPAQCLTLDAGSFLHWRADALRASGNSWRLTRQGALDEVRVG